MSIRPIDIARKLNISATSLRAYEARGLIPPVDRTPSGYRRYTDEHVAYFACIRALMPGFGMTRIVPILRAVMARDIPAAFWLATRAQADLYQQRVIADKIVANLLHKQPPTTARDHLTIHEVSRATGVPATAIRYWDRVGLITVRRGQGNNYRLFTPDHVRQILAIYALNLSVYANHRRYSVERVRDQLADFDYDDATRISALTADLARYLDTTNRAQIRGIAALHHLCLQVEASHFTLFDHLITP